MRLKLFPREEKFFEFFKRQGKIIEDAAEVLQAIFDDYGSLERHVKRIEDLEHEGDAVVREVAMRLNKIFVTPIDREDIHELSSVLDDVIDYIRAAAMRLILFDVKAPTKPAKELASVILKSAQEINRALENLETFKDVTLYTERIKEYEKLGDRINRGAVGSLFQPAEKGALPVIDVIKWQEIYERLETAIDKCEDVAQIIEGITLKHA